MGQGPIGSLLNALVGTLATPMKADVAGAMWVAQRRGRSYAAVANGNVGVAANQAGVVTSAALATTYTGLCLSNPAGSGKNLSILNASGAFIVAPSTVTGVGLIVGYATGGITAHTTPLTPFNALIGGGNALVAKADSACTLVGTPAWARWLAETPTATTLPYFSADIDGGIIIPPGGYVALGTTIASPAAGFVGSIEWEEI